MDNRHAAPLVCAVLLSCLKLPRRCVVTDGPWDLAPEEKTLGRQLTVADLDEAGCSHPLSKRINTLRPLDPHVRPKTVRLRELPTPSRKRGGVLVNMWANWTLRAVATTTREKSRQDGGFRRRGGNPAPPPRSLF